MGIVEGCCGYRARGVSIRGKFVFFEKRGVQDAGGRQVAKHSSDPRQAYPGQTSGTGPCVSCGYCCPLCRARGRYPGKIRFIEPQGGNGARRRVSGTPSSGTPRESQANFRVGTVWGL